MSNFVFRAITPSLTKPTDRSSRPPTKMLRPTFNVSFESLVSLDEQKALWQTPCRHSYRGLESCCLKRPFSRAFWYKTLRLEAIVILKVARLLNKPGVHRLPWNRNIVVEVSHDKHLFGSAAESIFENTTTPARYLIIAFAYKKRVYTLTRDMGFPPYTP